MHPILSKLDGGDRRSIGRSNEVVADVLNDPGLFDGVFSGLLADNPLLRMRSADAIEKITVQHPEYLLPYKARLIEHIARIDQKEVRWHVAQMFSRVQWTQSERQQVLSVLMEYLNDRSSIVRTFAMQALADLARQAPELQPMALLHLRELTATGTPAMKARGRKLLAEMSGPAKRLRDRE
jgi:hypothetical protein